MVFYFQDPEALLFWNLLPTLATSIPFVISVSKGTLKGYFPMLALIATDGWHALTVGKGVEMRVDRDSHALPDGQSVPPIFTNWPAVYAVRGCRG